MRTGLNLRQQWGCWLAGRQRSRDSARSLSAAGLLYPTPPTCGALMTTSKWNYLPRGSSRRPAEDTVRLICLSAFVGEAAPRRFGRAGWAAADDNATCAERPLRAALRNRLLSPIVRMARAAPRVAGFCRAVALCHFFLLAAPFDFAAGCLTRASLRGSLSVFTSFVSSLRVFLLALFVPL